MSAAFPPFVLGFVVGACAVLLYAAGNCTDVSGLTHLVGVQGHVLACRVP